MFFSFRKEENNEKKIKKILKNIIIKKKCKNKKVKWDKSCIFSINDFDCEGMNVFHENTTFIGKIGFGSYIGSNCNINATIGRFCSISSNVITINGVHLSKMFVSTFPCFLVRQSKMDLLLLMKIFLMKTFMLTMKII